MSHEHTPPPPARRPDQLLEEGAAFMDLAGIRPASPERFDVVVIGGGQAGLSVGHHLAGRGLRFCILEAGARVGDQWRQRWDSLRLFTPARFDSLDGMPFPAPADYFPTKDEMADYLEAYAARFSLPVRTAMRVQRLSRREGRFRIEAGGRVLEADQVVVAMASYQTPRLPAFASQLDPTVVQLHSKDYRRPDQLRPGPVLIAGAGNSGAEIAKELAGAHEIWMAGRDTGHVPFRMEGLAGRKLLAPLVLRVLFHRLLTIRTPMGRKARPKIMKEGAPLIRVKPKQLRALGVHRVGRVQGVRDGLPLLADGRVLPAANVIWCTGFHPGFDWIDLPVLDADGEPLHDGGVSTAAEGLYFVGLHFLYSMSSTMIHGVGRDAARIAGAVTTRARATTEVRQAPLQATGELRTSV
jgi:putative flavoprotein involved in K+ transport